MFRHARQLVQFLLGEGPFLESRRHTSRGGLDTPGAVGVAHLGEHRPLPLGVRQHRHDRWLVRDHVPQPARMPGREVEGHNSPRAAAEHVCGIALGEHLLQHPGSAPAPPLDALFLDGLAEPAVGEAERVVRHDGEAFAEVGDEVVEAHGVSGAAGDDEEDGAGTAHVVVITHLPKLPVGRARRGMILRPSGPVCERADTGRVSAHATAAPVRGVAPGQAIGAYTTPSLSISVPERPVKPTICQPDGAVNVAVSVVAVPEVRVRALSVVNAAEKILVRPSF